MAEPTALFVEAVEPEAPPAGRLERLALHSLQLLALAAVLVAVTWRAFELDRFFVPKELVLHVAAFLGGLLALRSFRRCALGRVDLLLGLFLALSILSAILATNPWAGARAAAISASAVALFWTARALAAAGLERPLLAGLAGAVIAGAATSLLQTYGVESELFSSNRVPGGTFGNRNFIAHFCAFGLPLVVLMALRARRPLSFGAWALGAALVVAVLILTRSRAAWLAFAAVAAVHATAPLLSPALRRDRRSAARLAAVMLLSGAAVAAVLTLPNSLRWRSHNPYLESVASVANFQEGSGRGRLIQYRRSLLIALDEPLLGAGPGNWAVVYPEYAARRDPSLDSSVTGMTANPWPSSDWVAYVTERGAVAATLLGLALLGVALTALRRLRRAEDAAEGVAAVTVLAVLAGVVVAGTFDAVLLLAVPTLIVWTALGSLYSPPAAPHARLWAKRQTLVLAAVALLALVGALRSGAQLVGMGLYTTEVTESLRLAARIDPGNYRVQLRLARLGNRAQRCRHARAAHDLYPHAATARRLARNCR